MIRHGPLKLHLCYFYTHKVYANSYIWHLNFQCQFLLCVCVFMLFNDIINHICIWVFYFGADVNGHIWTEDVVVQLFLPELSGIDSNYMQLSLSEKEHTEPKAANHAFTEDIQSYPTSMFQMDRDVIFS